MPTGDVSIQVLDGQGGVVSAPLSTVQAVIGMCSGGTAFQIVATRNPTTLTSTCGYGTGVEAAALACVAGGTVLFVKVPVTTKGAASAVVNGAGNTSTSVVTVTTDATNGAFDDYNVKVKVFLGGTIATGPITIQVSLDAGRNYGPNISLGTANTYAISNTGLTLNFAAGTLVTGDSFTFHTTGPCWLVTDVQTALNTLAGSQYGVAGWGSLHIVGNDSTSTVLEGGVPGGKATTIEGYLDTLAASFQFTRAIVSARDASPPAAYGGTGETDATWYAALATDYAAVSAKRICAAAGYYNIPTAIGSNASAGAPAYRRSLAWALAARQVQIPAQRMASRVKDGAIQQIVINPTSDPNDGFLYHDDGVNGPLDTARFVAARSRKKLPGLYFSHPNLMSPPGSDFNWLPKGNVMDTACDLFHALCETFIDSDVRTNANGTIYEADAKFLETQIGRSMDSILLTQGMVSSATSIVVDRSANLATTSKLPVAATIFGKGYIDEIDGTIGFNNPLTA